MPADLTPFPSDPSVILPHEASPKNQFPEIETLSPEEWSLISGAVRRVMAIMADLARARQIPPDCRVTDPRVMMLDIAVIHARQTPLDLRAMCYGNEEDLMHDVSAIVSFINRHVGRMPAEIRLRNRKIAS